MYKSIKYLEGLQTSDLMSLSSQGVLTDSRVQNFAGKQCALRQSTFFNGGIHMRYITQYNSCLLYTSGE